MEVSAVVSALNEEKTIGMVIEEIPTKDMESKGYITNIIVVDIGSTDKTGEIAAKKGAHVILEPVRGKGMEIISGTGIPTVL